MQIIVKALVGSHMFGTNTPESDKDYRAIFIPDIKDIILTTNIQKLDTVRKSSGSDNTKNTKDDIDLEMWSLKKFMRLVALGDTNALELLFVPEENILEKSELWDYIIAHRDELLHSSVTAFVGYCKTQADKYGLKGSRISALKEILAQLGTINEDKRLSDVWDHFKGMDLPYTEFGVDVLNGNIEHKMPYMEVCGKKFQGTIKVRECRQRINLALKGYGDRAKKAEQNEGVDWKAMSHAMRVCYQARELLSKGAITLPLRFRHRIIVSRIKEGRMDFQTVQNKLEHELEMIKYDEKHSDLPDKIDEKKWCEDFIVKSYLEEAWTLYLT